jgi:hypothetical protein
MPQGGGHPVDARMRLGKVEAVFTDPLSEAYCLQSSNLEDFPPSLRLVLKYRLSEDSYLCRPYHDGSKWEVNGPHRTQEEFRDDLVAKIDHIVGIQNAAHPIYLVHQLLNNLTLAQLSNGLPVSYVEAAKDVRKVVIEGKPAPFYSGKILQAATDIPQDLIVIGCEPTRMGLADQLLPVVKNASVLLRIVSSLSLPQAENHVQVIIDNTESQIVGFYPNRRFDELTAPDFASIGLLIEEHNFALNDAIGVINNFGNRIHDLNLDELTTKLDFVKNCNEDNANEVMNAIQSGNVQLPAFVDVRNCSSMASQIETNHEEMLGAAMHRRFHEVENLDASVLVPAAALTVVGAVCLVMFLYYKSNLLQPLKSLARNLFFCGRNTEASPASSKPRVNTAASTRRSAPLTEIRVDTMTKTRQTSFFTKDKKGNVISESNKLIIKQHQTVVHKAGSSRPLPPHRPGGFSTL